MAFKERLNYNPEGHLVRDEIVTVSNGIKKYPFSHNNLIVNKGILIYTGRNSTGIKITDFTIVDHPTKSWVKEILFGNSVLEKSYFVTYYSEGDENDADDMNELKRDIEGNKERLAVRYVHKGNKALKPISVDLATGIFTTDEDIPLTVGMIRDTLTNYPNEHPDKLFQEWNGTNNYALKVLSNRTFHLTLGTTPITYAVNAHNQSVDLTKIQFEYDILKPTIDLSMLKMGDEFRIVLMGVRDRPSWSYTPLSFYTDKGYMSNVVDIGGQDGRDFMYFYCEKIYKYYPETGIFFSLGGRIANKQWSGGTTWQYTSNLDTTRLFDNYKGFKLDRVSVLFNMGNNFVVEIYTINKDV